MRRLAAPRARRRGLDRRDWGLVFIGALAVQLVLLYWPSTDGAPHIAGLDILIHMASFAVVLYAGVRFRFPMRALALLLVVHAVVSELVQHWLLPQRTGDWQDLTADVVGVALARLALRESDRRRTRPEPPVPEPPAPEPVAVRESALHGAARREAARRYPGGRSAWR